MNRHDLLTCIPAQRMRCSDRRDRGTFGEVAGSDGSGAWALSAGYGAGPAWIGAYAQQLKNLADTETRKILGLGGNYRVVSSLTRPP